MAGIRLTARGAFALIFVLALVGQVTGSAMLAGGAFVAGCVAAALLTQRRDLLSLVVSPPLIFFTALLLRELVRAVGSGSFLQSLGLGVFTSLSGEAPWLFAGTLLVPLIALKRGLPAAVRALRAELRAAPPPRRRRGPADAAAYSPEPEGYFPPRVYGSPRDKPDR